MYIYQNKQTEKLVIAIRFQHYSEYSLEEVKEMFKSYPYEISYFLLPNGYQDQKITFVDKNNNLCTIKNGDWLIFKDKNDYVTLSHLDFKMNYTWVGGDSKTKERLFSLLKGE